MSVDEVSDGFDVSALLLSSLPKMSLTLKCVYSERSLTCPCGACSCFSAHAANSVTSITSAKHNASFFTIVNYMLISPFNNFSA